jgi:hypothetical protein
MVNKIRTVERPAIQAAYSPAGDFLFAPVAGFAFSSTTEATTGHTVQIDLAISRVVTVSGGIQTLTLSDGAVLPTMPQPYALRHVLVFDYTVGANDHSPNVEIPALSQTARRSRTPPASFLFLR